MKHLTRAALQRIMAEGTGERICVAAEGRGLIAAALRGAAAGGAGILLPYATTAGVVAAACRDTGIRRVFSDVALDLPEDLEQYRIAGEPGDEVAPGGTESATPELPFLWLYTGGSTGVPRIWSKTPANLFGEARYLAQRFQVGPEDRILATVPPRHIYGLLFSVALPMVSGAIVAAETPFFPQQIRDAAGGATLLVSSPPHYKAMSAAAPERGRLRLAFSSGGLLTPAQATAFEEATGLGITEIYGSTETGGIATRNRLSGETAWTPLGPVDHQVQGERLLVRSPFLSPELPRDLEGFFRTGDRGAEGPRGTFELLGREDGVCKVGGKRVVLEEVRELLMALDGVEDAAVLALPDPEGRGALIAALYCGDLEPQTLRGRAVDRLEPQMQPRLLRRVERIPRLAMGKLDGAATRDLLATPSDSSEDER